jgi:hypothetical protein
MAKQKNPKQTERRELTGLERLGMRVSAMINAPLAQLNRRVTIHRLDTDEDEAWDGVMELLAETDGLDMTFNDDGTVTLRWEPVGDEGRSTGEGEVQALEEPKVEEVPF